MTESASETARTALRLAERLDGDIAALRVAIKDADTKAQEAIELANKSLQSIAALEKLQEERFKRMETMIAEAKEIINNAAERFERTAYANNERINTTASNIYKRIWQAAVAVGLAVVGTLLGVIGYLYDKLNGPHP